MIFRWLTERRRRTLLAHPFPDAWTRVLEANVAVYALLDEATQQRLRALTQVFVAEKEWEGCGGLELDDEIRVTIAGSACQMLLGRDHDLFKRARSILVYPSSVWKTARPRSFFDPRAELPEDPVAVQGYAQQHGPVVLAWDSALRGARDPDDGRNLVIHEFAHQIDFLDGASDGTPPLPDFAARKAWAEACSRAFLADRKRAERGKKTVLDSYATKNEAEFFAVASEAFFERAHKMARDLPAVYAVLVDFYRQDPDQRARHSG